MWERVVRGRGPHGPPRRGRAGGRLAARRGSRALRRVLQAQNAGADFLLCGTVFKSETHEDIEPNGLRFLASLRGEIDIPIIAVGGITQSNVLDCIQSGAQGVAMIRAFSKSHDPEKVARSFYEL